MSNPGYFYGNNIAPGESGGVPDDYWRKMMAQSLLGSVGATGLGGGLANAGSTLIGALAMRNIQNQEKQRAQNPSMPSNIFGLGGD